MKRN
jgi:hypothetical protein